MIDGKERTINECVGRYDPETRVVTPKKPHKKEGGRERITAELNPSIDFSKIGSRSYGGVYLLDRLLPRFALR